MDWIVELGKLGLVGLIAGIFSSVVANRDHRQRIFWEYRARAYQQAIRSVYDLIYYYERHMATVEEGTELSPEFSIRLNSIWNKSFHNVRRLSDAGAFLLSARADQALRRFLERPNYASHYEH